MWLLTNVPIFPFFSPEISVVESQFAVCVLFHHDNVHFCLEEVGNRFCEFSTFWDKGVIKIQYAWGLTALSHPVHSNTNDTVFKTLNYFCNHSTFEMTLVALLFVCWELKQSRWTLVQSMHHIWHLVHSRRRCYFTPAHFSHIWTWAGGLKVKVWPGMFGILCTAHNSLKNLHHKPAKTWLKCKVCGAVGPPAQRSKEMSGCGSHRRLHNQKRTSHLCF